MWRSFLSRSQPLLSHLRHPKPKGCSYGDTAGAAALGSADRRILRRAYTSNSALGPDVDGEKSSPRPRRHLYVVLDEMNTGHSVYMLNVDDLDGGDEDAVTGFYAAPPSQVSLPRRLPEPVLRLGYHSLGTSAHFEALGSKVVATGHSNGNGKITFVYDTEMARLDVGKPPPKGVDMWHCHAVAAGNKLYTFGSNGKRPHYLCERSALHEFDGLDSTEGSTVIMMRGQTKEWAWNKMPSPLRRAVGGGGSSSFVESYAVHPDGRTIFVSCSFECNPELSFMFSLDTKSGESVRRGCDWRLPFCGQGYYDRDLDAWVGIREVDYTYGLSERTPYLCSCDIPDITGTDGPVQASAWKMCTEELKFLETPPALSRADRVLVHTGHGRFCLVEVVVLLDGGEEVKRRIREGHDCLLHVTMFRAKYGKNGELLVTPCRPGRTYLVPNNSVGKPSAFWI